MGKLADEVQRIYDRDGEVKPSVLVKEAKRKNSPIHDMFEWDDAKAGKEHRLWQARMYIRQVKIVVEEQEVKLVNLPVTGTPVKEEGVYKPISVIVQNPDEYDLVKGELTKRLKAINEYLDDLEEAAANKGLKMVDAINKSRGYIGKAANTLEIHLM